MTSLTCGIKKTKQTSEYNKKEADSDLEKKLVAISGERGMRRDKTRIGD